MALSELLADAPDLVKSPDYVAMWCTRGAYGSPTEGKTAQEIATPAFPGHRFDRLRSGRVRR